MSKNCLWKAVQDVTQWGDIVLEEILGPMDQEVHLDHVIDFFHQSTQFKPCLLHYDPYSRDKEGREFRAYAAPDHRLDIYPETRIYIGERHASVDRAEVPEPIYVLVLL